jgi:hypothetical protein
MNKIKTICSILFIGLLTLTSCSKKDCFQFTTTQVTSVSPALPGYPQTVSGSTSQCDITEKEAKDICGKGSSTSSSNSGGYVITVKTTMTYK